MKISVKTMSLLCDALNKHAHKATSILTRNTQNGTKNQRDISPYMAKHRRTTDGTSSRHATKQFMESYRMNTLKSIYHSWIWALEMKRRVCHDMAVFGHINPGSIKDIDKFLRERGVTA